MYKSPIETIQEQVTKQFEEYIVNTVHKYGVNVDKEELVKALMYDRKQYDKGYADAKSEQRWIPVTERLPDEDIETGYGRHLSQEVLVTCVNHEDDDERFTDMAYRCDGKWLLCHPNDGDNDLPYWCEILAWMPLPEPYKVGQDE